MSLLPGVDIVVKEAEPVWLHPFNLLIATVNVLGSQ